MSWRQGVAANEVATAMTPQETWHNLPLYRPVLRERGRPAHPRQPVPAGGLRWAVAALIVGAALTGMLLVGIVSGYAG